MSSKRDAKKPKSTREKSASNHSGEQLHCLVSRAFYAYLTWLDRRLAETGLNKYLKPGMGPVLFELYKDDNLIIRDLVERTRFVPSTLTRTLKKMQRAKLITQHKDSSDGRAIRIKLTALGRSLETACVNIASEITAVMLSGIDEAQLLVSSDMLDKVAENLRAEVLRD